MENAKRIDLTNRVRSKRKVPPGCQVSNLTPFGMAAFLGSFPIGDSRRYSKVELEFFPECPNPDPVRIPYDEWMAVDSMTCTRGFDDDLAWFRGMVASFEAYDDIVIAASDQILLMSRHKPHIDLPYECNKFVLPAFVEHLVYRRVILWCFRSRRKFKDVAEMLSFSPGAKKQFPSLRSMLSRVGLNLGIVSDPWVSNRVMEEEKHWLRTARPE